MFSPAHCFMIEPRIESCPAAVFFNLYIICKISDLSMRGIIKL